MHAEVAQKPYMGTRYSGKKDAFGSIVGLRFSTDGQFWNPAWPQGPVASGPLIGIRKVRPLIQVMVQSKGSSLSQADDAAVVLRTKGQLISPAAVVMP